MTEPQDAGKPRPSVRIERVATQLSAAEEARITDILFESLSSSKVMLAVAAFEPDRLRSILRDRVRQNAERHSLFVARQESELSADGDDAPAATAAKIVGTMLLNLPDVGWSSSGSMNVREGFPEDVIRWQDEEFYPWVTAWQRGHLGEQGVKDTVYINLLAVDPAARGRGTGSALSRHAFRLADDLEVPCTLFTQEANAVRLVVRLYEHLGMQVIGGETFEIRGEITQWWIARRMNTAVSQTRSLGHDSLAMCHGILVDAFATHALVASRSGFDPVFLSETIRAKLEEWPGVGRVWVAQEEQPVSSGQATTVRTSAVRAVALAIEPGGSLDVRRAIPADISLSIKQWQQDVFYPLLADLDQKAYGGTAAHAQTFFVNLLAVDTRSRSLGTGEKLVRSLCAHADRQGWTTSMYVTSARLVRWYALFGFQDGASGQFTMPSGEKAQVWALCRPPAAQGNEPSRSNP